MERKSYRSDLTNKQWQLIVQNMVILNYAKNFWTEPGLYILLLKEHIIHQDIAYPT